MKVINISYKKLGIVISIVQSNMNNMIQKFTINDQIFCYQISNIIHENYIGT